MSNASSFVHLFVASSNCWQMLTTVGRRRAFAISCRSLSSNKRSAALCNAQFSDSNSRRNERRKMQDLAYIVTAVTVFFVSMAYLLIAQMQCAFESSNAVIT